MKLSFFYESKFNLINSPRNYSFITSNYGNFKEDIRILNCKTNNLKSFIFISFLFLRKNTFKHGKNINWENVKYAPRQISIKLKTKFISWKMNNEKSSDHSIFLLLFFRVYKSIFFSPVLHSPIPSMRHSAALSKKCWMTLLKKST